VQKLGAILNNSIRFASQVNIQKYQHKMEVVNLNS